MIEKDMHPEYRALSADKDAFAHFAEVIQELGPDLKTWEIQEVGDGNINLIFKLASPRGKILVKQAVPYLRCVGEAWPLGLQRVFFEYRAYREYEPFVPQYLPRVHSYSPISATIVMEYLDSEIIFRKGLIAGVRYPEFSKHIAEFMARTLFFTSDLYLKGDEKRKKVQAFSGNAELCKLTEEVIFTDPFSVSERNHWTSPQLDSHAGNFRNDLALKKVVSELKFKFLSSTEALVHGDLHTGSIMINAQHTHVIDPEFAFYGPMGLDVGLLIGNLLLSYYSQPGLGENESSRLDYQEWILQQIDEVWSHFVREFSTLWKTSLKGDHYSPLFFSGSESQSTRDELLAEYLQRLWNDSLGFAGVEMIRRILGLAHVEDFKIIADPNRRGKCEAHALDTAYDLLVNRETALQTPLSDWIRART